MDLQEVYDSAGQCAGLEIWRVENFKLAPVPKKCYGTFYSGDCYLALHTIMEPRKSQMLHYWIGSESSQDERGTAAAATTGMDTAQGGLPVQAREIETNESDEFKAYFDNVGGIRYKNGGVASGFVHAEVNEDSENRLLRVKGRSPNIFAKEVPMDWSSVTNDDVYIFEIGADIYRWKAPEANRFEWMKSASLCASIKENDQGGRGTIHTLEDESFPEAVTAAMAGTKPDSFPSSGADRLGQQAELTPSLYKVSLDTGSMETTEVGKGPGLAKSILESDDCYILDCGENGTIYAWKGSKSDQSEKDKVMENAISFIADKNYGALCGVLVMGEGEEVRGFKKYFDW